MSPAVSPRSCSIFAGMPCSNWAKDGSLLRPARAQEDTAGPRPARRTRALTGQGGTTLRCLHGVAQVPLQHSASRAGARRLCTACAAVLRAFVGLKVWPGGSGLEIGLGRHCQKVPLLCVFCVFLRPVHPSICPDHAGGRKLTPPSVSAAAAAYQTLLCCYLLSLLYAGGYPDSLTLYRRVQSIYTVANSRHRFTTA